MTQSNCAFCKQSGPFTREHLWPASLHKRLIKVNQQLTNSFWLARIQKELENEPVLKDVCASCNNIILSELDEYICSFFDSTLIYIPERYEKISFIFDYHLLKKWLLKLSYNSARIHNSPDLKALEFLLPYILGKDDKLGRSVQLFLQLTYPELIADDDLKDEFKSCEGFLFKPSMNRAGHMFFKVQGIGQKLMRAVHLRSYSFYLSYWKPLGSRLDQDDFESVFTELSNETILLRKSKPTVSLECNGTGAWTSFRQSRNGKFLFKPHA